jgi:hypothetical protein
MAMIVCAASPGSARSGTVRCTSWRTGAVLIGKGNRAGKRRYLDAIKSRTSIAKHERWALLEWVAE